MPTQKLGFMLQQGREVVCGLKGGGPGDGERSAEELVKSNWNVMGEINKGDKVGKDVSMTLTFINCCREQNKLPIWQTIWERWQAQEMDRKQERPSD